MIVSLFKWICFINTIFVPPYNSSLSFLIWSEHTCVQIFLAVWSHIQNHSRVLVITLAVFAHDKAWFHISGTGIVYNTCSSKCCKACSCSKKHTCNLTLRHNLLQGMGWFDLIVNCCYSRFSNWFSIECVLFMFMNFIIWRSPSIAKTLQRECRICFTFHFHQKVPGITAYSFPVP